MSKKQKQKKNRLKNYARFSSLTIQMGIIVVGGAYFGDYLDSLNSSQQPIFTIIFSLIGISIALYTGMKGMINK